MTTLPLIIEPEYVRAEYCDGDCPPWWFILALHVKAGECTPMTAMWLHRWHLSHSPSPFADAPLDGGLLH